MQVLLCPEKSRPQENKDKVLLGYTAMVDAWAMGILAYELLVGKPPFEKQSRAATYEHIMYRKPEFPVTMSADAKDFVFLALTKVCLSADKSCSTYVLGVSVLQAAQKHQIWAIPAQKYILNQSVFQVKTVYPFECAVRVNGS